MKKGLKVSSIFLLLSILIFILSFNIVSALTISNIKSGNGDAKLIADGLKKGDTYITNRTFTITSDIPESVTNLPAIIQADSVPSYLEFNVDEDVRVYLAWDMREEIPSDWTDTDERILVSDSWVSWPHQLTPFGRKGVFHTIYKDFEINDDSNSLKITLPTRQKKSNYFVFVEGETGVSPILENVSSTLLVANESINAITCPQGYNLTGKFKVGNETNEDIVAVDYLKEEYSNTWLGLCAVDDSAVIINKVDYSKTNVPTQTPTPTPTPPSEPPQETEFNFVASSDFKGGGFAKVFSEQISALNLEPELGIMCGDIAMTPARASSLMGELAEVQFPVKGNHDGSINSWDAKSRVEKIGGSNYNEMTGGMTMGYSFDYKNSHFVGLIGMVTAQLTWLDADLTAAENRGLKHAFIWSHPALISTSSKHFWNNPPANVIPILNKHPIVSAWFGGHGHVFSWVHVDSNRVNGITNPFESFMVGTMGEGPYGLKGTYNFGVSGYGFMNIKVIDDETFNVEWYDKGKNVIRWSASCVKDEGCTPNTPSLSPDETMIEEESPQNWFSNMIFQISNLFKKENPEGVLMSALNNRNTPFDGYIVEFEDEPTLIKEIQLRNESEKNRDSVLGSIPLVNNLLVTPMNVEEKVNRYSARVAGKHSSFKKEIMTEIEGAKIVNEFNGMVNAIVIENITPEQAQKIEDMPGIKRVTPNYIMQLALKDAAQLIGAVNVWNDWQYTGKGVTIVIIDDGVNYLLPEFGGCIGPNCKVINGWDYKDKYKQHDDNDPYYDTPKNFHGTPVAFAALGKGKDMDNDGKYCEVNEGEICGIAPDANLFMIKIRINNYATLLRAMERVVDLDGDGKIYGVHPEETDINDKADVVSMSLGTNCNSQYDHGCGPDDIASQTVDKIVKQFDIPIVISAGNEGPKDKSIKSPAAAEYAISVGSVDKNGVLSSFSSKGPVKYFHNHNLKTLHKPDFVSYGENILSLNTSGHYKYVNGTSFSTPIVAGAIALLKEKYPSITVAQIKDVLARGAINLGLPIDSQGYGLVNIKNSLEIPISTDPTPPIIPPTPPIIPPTPPIIPSKPVVLISNSYKYANITCNNGTKISFGKGDCYFKKYLEDVAISKCLVPRADRKGVSEINISNSSQFVLFGSCTNNLPCFESDSGIKYDIKGVCYFTNGTGVETRTDGCLKDANGLDTGYLAEAHCRKGKCTKPSYKCPNGCKDGACLPARNTTCPRGYSVKGEFYVGEKSNLSQAINFSKDYYGNELNYGIVMFCSRNDAAYLSAIESDEDEEDISDNYQLTGKFYTQFYGNGTNANFSDGGWMKLYSKNISAGIN